MEVSKLLRLAGRVASASPKELKTRLEQAVFAAHNCVASMQDGSALSSKGHLRSLGVRDTELADWWKQRQSNWFIDDHRVELLRARRDDLDSQIPWVLEQADLVVSGKMPLFSYEPVDFKGANRWHRDFILQKTAERKPYAMVKYLDANEVGDSKHVWEPNRFSWAHWLGIASLVTGEEKYAAKFVELAEDWFAQSPYPIGINYCSALECAFRNYAWLWSLSYFQRELQQNTTLLDQLLRGIWIGSHHIEKNLSTYFAPNTHIAGEGFGLYACGAALPEFAEAKAWRSHGASILEEQAAKQLHADGTHRELSSSYHVYMTDFYVQAMVIARETGFVLSPFIQNAARKLATRLSELSPVDLHLPQFNDCDGGRVTCLVSNPLDAGPSLMAASSLFDDAGLLPRETSLRGYALLVGETDVPTQSLWPTGMSPLDRDLSGAYDSGIATHKTLDGDYVLFRATPFGYDDCPHSHDAGLGVLLNFANTPILMDSGVGSYTQAEGVRNGFRSAVGKNAPLVDGTGPSVPDGWFSWLKRTDCDLVSFKRFHDGFVARGKHIGFSNDSGRHVCVQREVMMLNFGIMVIVDCWDANRQIQLESRFTLNPELDVDLARRVLKTQGLEVHFHTIDLNGGGKVETLKNRDRYSSNYGQIAETNSISFRTDPTRRCAMATIFSRVGAVVEQSDDIIQFEADDTGTRLMVSDHGVQPIRNDSNPVFSP